MKHSNDIISKLFFSMLPVQILIFAMGFINTDIAEKLNYTYDNPRASTYPSYSKNEDGQTLYEYIKFILDDMNNETEDRTYTFTSGDVSVSIYIGRGE